MSSAFKIRTLNNISDRGLERLPRERYEVGSDIDEPDAIIVRSADMHALAIPASVKAVGRAGAGTNNVPVAELSKRGVPVVNAPGANANAVKELVIAGIVLSARGFLRDTLTASMPVPDYGGKPNPTAATRTINSRLRARFGASPSIDPSSSRWLQLPCPSSRRSP